MIKCGLEDVISSFKENNYDIYKRALDFLVNDYDSEVSVFQNSKSNAITFTTRFYDKKNTYCLETRIYLEKSRDNIVYYDNYYSYYKTFDHTNLSSSVIKVMSFIVANQYYNRAPSKSESSIDLLNIAPSKTNQSLSTFDLILVLKVVRRKTNFFEPAINFFSIQKNKEYSITNDLDLLFEIFIMNNKEAIAKLPNTFTKYNLKLVNKDDYYILSRVLSLRKKQDFRDYIDLSDFFRILENEKRKFIIEFEESASKEFVKTEINSIETTYDFNVKIREDNKYYYLDFSKFSYLPITRNYEYIYVDYRVYHIDASLAKLLKNITLDNTSIIKIDKQRETRKYIEEIYPLVRDFTSNDLLPESLKDEYIFTDPILNMYFDYEKGILSAIPKVKYNDLEIHVLTSDAATSKIIRAKEKEVSMINYLIEHGFLYNPVNNVYEISEEEKIIDFILNELGMITEFNVYTSNIIKKMSSTRDFDFTSKVTMMTDFLSVDFMSENIDINEIKNILKSYRLKKKYHILKGGEVVSISDNSDLIELDKYTTLLGINYKDISDTPIRVKKYRALALDLAEKKDNIKLDISFTDFVKEFKDVSKLNMKIIEPDNAILRNYQNDGINFLLNLKKAGFAGILADDMGLGKTLQSIVYLNSSVPMNKHHTSLIVSPAALIYNWESEFKKFSPHTRLLIYQGSLKSRKEMLLDLSNVDVIITSYGLIREDIDDLKKITFENIILDEAQAIKNTKTLISHAIKELEAVTRFALSGTPIENKLEELYSIFDFILPGYFHTELDFKRKYVSNDENMKLLKSLVSPFIIRRHKKDVLKELPELIEENKILELSDSQKKVYLAELSRVNNEILLMSNSDFNKNKITILELISRLRQIAISPRMYLENYDGSDTKISYLLDMIDELTLEHKVVIYSEYVKALSIVKEELDKLKIDYYYLDGQTKSKERMNIALANVSKKDKIKVYLLTRGSGGVGLNLVGSDVVIHLDPWWNLAKEEQSTARLHRIGQTNKVLSIRLIARGTIEERILELQQNKKKIVDEIINAGDLTSSSALKLEDIKYLLKSTL